MEDPNAYLDSLWTAPSDKEILFVITMGLGGTQGSYYLKNYLVNMCAIYDEIHIVSFGKDNEGGGGITSEVVLEETKTAVQAACKSIHFVSKHFRVYLPASRNDFDHFMEIGRNTEMTYKYYEDKDFVSDIDDYVDINESLRNCLLRFFEKVSNGTVLIDNNAIFQSPSRGVLNLNFERMSWLPKMLASLNKDDNIFQLKKVGADRANAIAFFSKNAVYQTSLATLKRGIFARFPQYLSAGNPLKARIDAFGIAHPKLKSFLYLIYDCNKAEPDPDGVLDPDFESDPMKCNKAAATGGRRRKTRKMRKQRRKTRNNRRN